MIDAKKLVHGQRYYIRTKDSWQEVRWLNPGGVFFEREIYAYYEPHELTDAIPIPSPEQLAEMWEVIERVGGVTELEQETYDLARKLLEERT